jgi:hypothetical protein
MPSMLELSGAQSQKPTRYSPIFVSRFFNGLWTQRNPLRDAGSTRLEEKFYGGRGDGLVDGSNTEITPRLTIARRPGLSVYNSQSFSAVDQFYSFRLEDGETIYVMVDTPTAVYNGTGPNTKELIFNKTAGAGQTFFQSVLDILYMSDGPDQFKWVESPKTWQCNTQYYSGDFIVDPNGNLERVARVIDLPAGSPGSPTIGPNTAKTGVNSGGGVAWSNPSNVSSNSSQATVTTTEGLNASANSPGTVTPLVAGQYSNLLTNEWRTNAQDTGVLGYLVFSNFPGLSVPAGATILGVGISFEANADGNTSGTISSVALFSGSSLLGVAKTESQTLTPSVPAPQLSFGATSSAPLDKWGAPLTAAIINNSNFGFGVQLTVQSGIHSFLYSGASTSITVYYSTSGTSGSDFLVATNFGFNISNSPLGVQVSFESEVTNAAVDAEMTAQLVLSGNPIGEIRTLVPGDSLSQITLGGTNDLWGAILTITNVNSSTFGIQFQVTGGGSWAIGNVQFTITTSLGTLISGSCSLPPPIWPTQWGASVTDGTITWINNGSQVQLFAITPPANPPSVTNVALSSSSISGLTAWQANTWYLPALRIVDSNGFIQQVTTAGSTGASQPSWNDTYGGTTTDGSVVWTAGPSATWAANHAYVVGDAVSVTYNSVTPVGVAGLTSTSYSWAGHINTNYNTTYWTNSVTVKTDIFVVIQAGTTASSQPVNPSNSVNTPINPYPPSSNTWQSGIGTQVTDGSVIWKNAGPSATWTTIGATQAVAAVSSIIDTNSNQQQATVVGETGIVHPSWSTTVNQITTDNGQIWSNAGPVTSGIAVSPGTGVGASSLVWVYYYTYRNSLTGDESSTSPNSASILLAPNSAISVQGQYSSDPQVDTIRIYRTTAGEAVPFLLVEIPNSQLSGTWTYTDTTPDSGLNNLIEAPLDDVNNPPPVGLVSLAFHLGRMFGSVGNTVYYSGGPDTNPGNGATAFDPINYFIYPSKVVRMVPTANGLFVFTIDDIYLIAGQGTVSSPLYSQPYAPGIGLLSYNELDINAGIVYMKTTDGQILELQLGSGISEIGFPIGDQFTTLTTGTGNGFIPGAGYLTWHYSGSIDKAIYMANGTDGWFRCSTTASPETGINWSPKATLVDLGGAKAVQSIEVSPGVRKLLVGPLTNGPILQRDYSTNADNGSLYSAFATIGGLTLAQAGQTASVVFIETDCLQIGSNITPSTLFDELPSSNAFNSLATGSNPVNDPPQLASSTTVFNSRWWIYETQAPMLCRWAFLKLSWPTENFANELLQFAIFGAINKE